jgi:hypothetical protein
MWGARCVHQNGGAAGTEIQVAAGEVGLVVCCERIHNSQRGAELEKAFAVIAGRVERAVTGNYIEIVAGVHRRCTARHPDSRLASIRRVVESGGRLLNVCRRISSDQSVIRLCVFVGCPANVDDAIDQCETSTLQLRLRVESAESNCFRAVKCRFLGTRRQIQSMEALKESGARCGIYRLADNVDRLGVEIDHGSANDPRFRGDVPVATSDQIPASSGGDRNLASHQQTGLPQHDTRTAIGVEGIDAVVRCGDDDDVVLLAVGLHSDISGPKWLRVNGAVDGAGKQFSECGIGNRRSGEGIFGLVDAVARGIVVVSRNACEVGDAKGDRAAHRRIRNAGGCDRINARSGWCRVSDRDSSQGRTGGEAAASRRGPIHARGVVGCGRHGQSLGDR